LKRLQLTNNGRKQGNKSGQIGDNKFELTSQRPQIIV